MEELLDDIEKEVEFIIDKSLEKFGFKYVNATLKQTQKFEKDCHDRAVQAIKKAFDNVYPDRHYLKLKDLPKNIREDDGISYKTKEYLFKLHRYIQMGHYITYDRTDKTALMLGLPKYKTTIKTGDSAGKPVYRSYILFDLNIESTYQDMAKELGWSERTCRLRVSKFEGIFLKPIGRLRGKGRGGAKLYAVGYWVIAPNDIVVRHWFLHDRHKRNIIIGKLRKLRWRISKTTST